MIIIRIWHKSLLPYLPRQQLLGQWRECCCIAKNIAEKGTPNHILVNKIMDYPLEHFHYYAGMIHDEVISRGYKCEYSKFAKWIQLTNNHCTYRGLFEGWHNTRYLKQCMYNLEEKHDCQGVTDDEWNVLLKGYKNITGKDWEN